MAFKLGSSKGLQASGGNIKSKLAFKKGDSNIVPGTPIYRVNLEGTIQGEANMDGSIYIDKSITPCSEEEQHVLVHEMQHITDMKTGRTTYNDDFVIHDGQRWRRVNGEIIDPYTGKAVPEGGDLPWENNKV